MKSNRDRLRRTRDGRYEVGVYIEKDKVETPCWDGVRLAGTVTTVRTVSARGVGRNWAGRLNGIVARNV